jgi:hypothetical protein
VGCRADLDIMAKENLLPLPETIAVISASSHSLYWLTTGVQISRFTVKSTEE